MCGDGSDEGGKGKDEKWGKHKEKIKKCVNETKELMKCCPFPAHDDDVKNDPDCKHHLEGIEDKKHKEQFKAHACFSECLFKKKEILKENNELDTDKLKSSLDEFLVKKDAADFKEIAGNSIDYCLGECKEIYAEK